MCNFAHPWFVAGGWAIDLYVGRVTRPHKDVEVAILRRDQAHLRVYLAGWAFLKVASKELQPWPDGEWLELPVHAIHAHRDGAAPNALEILLNEGDDYEWRFRKNLAITRPMSLVRLRSPDGVPFLAPEIVLLYKAASSSRRMEDDADFQVTRDSLGGEQWQWLRAALEMHYPGHPWLEEM
jgi:hypothetical protein